jgi:rhodanese-related sulfurtransferase
MKHSPGFLAIVQDSLSRVREISVDEVRGDMKSSADFALVDVREDSEWDAAHASGAMHLGKGIIERDIETAIPDVDKKIVLYCGGGYRSALAADALQKMGYKSVFSLAGGWRAWKEAGMPIEEGHGS